MGISKIRGRGMGAANGFYRPPGLGHPMKHSAHMGPRGMLPRFPFPPPGVPMRMQPFPPPPMRPPGFMPHPPHCPAGVPRPPPFPPPLPPPSFMPPIPPMSSGPMPRGPMPRGPMPHGPMPHGPMPHGPMPHGPMPHGPMPPAMRGRPLHAGFGSGPPRRGKRGAASFRGGRGRIKNKQTSSNVGDDLDAQLDKPWVSEAVKSQILKKQELLERAKKSNSEVDWKEYKEHLEKLVVIVREAKLEFIGCHPEEGGVHYCEMCDKDLKNAQKLAEHLAEHTVCGYDGCTFQAHPKIIAKHVRLQHWTGLYKKICVANNPDDITKWIQERKNRYPTKANIERREAERKEQLDRGERLRQEPQDFNSFSRGRHARFAGRGSQIRMRGQHHRYRRTAVTRNSRELEGWNAQVVEEEMMARRGQLIPFPGTGAFPENQENTNADVKREEFSDGEWEGSPTITPSLMKPPLVASRALMSLMGSYASDQSDNEALSNEVTVVRVQPVSLSTATNHCSNTVIEDQNLKETAAQNGSDDDAPEEAPIMFNQEAVEVLTLPPPENKSLEEAISTNKRHRHRERITHLKGTKSTQEKISSATQQQRPVVARSRVTRYYRPTLLDKLLKEEIRHERNVILQCVTHVVKCNFFESVSTITDSAKHISCDNRIKVLAQCLSYIVHGDLLKKNETVDTDTCMLEST